MARNSKQKKKASPVKAVSRIGSLKAAKSTTKDEGKVSSSSPALKENDVPISSPVQTTVLNHIPKVEGKIYFRLKQVKEKNWQLTVGCSLPGKWIIHWGVSYVDDIGSEWDQPPEDMRPPGSIAIKVPLGSSQTSFQGFNWESHKEKADELASLGFTVLWLPTPTESVSPEGYMPKDLYNLNSRPFKNVNVGDSQTQKGSLQV